MAKSSGGRLTAASICLAFGLATFGYGQTPTSGIGRVLLGGTSARRLGADWQRDHLALLRSPRLEDRVGALRLYTYVMDVEALPILVQLARSRNDQERHLAATSFSRQFPLVRTELSRLGRAGDGEGYKRTLQEFNDACKDPDISLVLYCGIPLMAELYLNARQDAAHARKALDYEVNLFCRSNKSLEEVEGGTSQDDLDAIPKSICGEVTKPIITDIVSHSFPNLYLESVRKAKGDHKRFLISNYEGPWSIAFEDELYEFVRKSESSWPLFNLMVKHPRPEAVSLLRSHLQSRWAKVRLWAAWALIELEPSSAWEILTENLGRDQSEAACFFLWQDLLNLKDRRTANWVRSTLQNSPVDKSKQLLQSLPILEDSLIAKAVADYALSPGSAERIAAFEALSKCDLPEADALFMSIGPDAPRELCMIWCERAGYRNDVAAIPRLRSYAKSSDAELAEIAAATITQITGNLNQNGSGN